MQITASMVKELRERTGAGMMECKRALEASAGDMEGAIEAMRKSGLAKADKKSERIAAEGVIAIASADPQTAAMVEINCETDFVAKGDDFAAFAAQVAECVLQGQPATLEALAEMSLGDDDGWSVETTRQALVARLGENIQVRRFERLRSQHGRLAWYLHGTRIGVLVDVSGGDEALARDLAMHVSWSQPLCVDESDVPPETLEKERAFLRTQAADSGKSEEIVERMVAGRLQKYLREITLLGQPFVKDPDTSVGELLAAAGAQVHGFARFAVGEGKEKKQEDFAEEVMAQVEGR